VKNCDLDLSVEWLQVFFRNIININEGISEFCMPSQALVRFSERHVTQFGPIASTYLALRSRTIKNNVEPCM